MFGLGVRNHLPLRALILSDSRDQDLFSQVMDLQLHNDKSFRLGPEVEQVLLAN